MEPLSVAEVQTIAWCDSRTVILNRADAGLLVDLADAYAVAHEASPFLARQIEVVIAQVIERLKARSF